jgi:hypothetical protein
MTDLETYYTTEAVAASLGVKPEWIREILKRPGAPSPVRLSDSKYARMRWTRDDVKALDKFLRPESPEPRRRRKRKSPS